jgi:hypothetical protein
MDGEIIINDAKLEKAERRLNKLKESIEYRNAQVSFSTAKGDTVDQLIELGLQLERIREKLVLLYESTANAMSATRTSFDETDNSIANYFNVFWVGINEK